MIFLFSGTGNSLYAAQKLSVAIGDEVLIDMAKAVNSAKTKYTVGAQESVGFVFPNYYGTLPITVRRFIHALTLEDVHGKYVWAAVTCGSEMMTVPKHLSAALAESGIKLNAVFELKMPDNYVIAYNPSEKNAAERVISEADERLPFIIDKIRNKAHAGTGVGIMENAMGTVLSQFYNSFRNTKSFVVNDRCISCGLCEKNCPETAIKIKDGKPVWVKDKCAHCVACISRCPAFAIEYGKATQKRRRYINPVLL